MPEERLTNPKNYFLNEHHELAVGEKEGGGRFTEYVDIDWHNKAQRLSDSIKKLVSHARNSPDPVSRRRYFMLALPPEELAKRSSAKNASQGKLTQIVDYDVQHSRGFSRLGLDLVQVNGDGTAVVHAQADRLEQLQSSAAIIDRLGKREQSRWAIIDLFDWIPAALRADPAWLNSLSNREPNDTILEFQPLLVRLEIEQLMAVITGVLEDGRRERFRGLGRDFSGRIWLRCSLLPSSISKIAEGFPSVQSIHSPLFATVVARKANSQPRIIVPPNASQVIDPRTLPCVAVVDTGVPQDHVCLAPYRRSQFIAPDSYGLAVGDHGCRVASRVVFGELGSDGMPPDPIPLGTCSFYDVNVATNASDLNEKEILPSLEAVIGNAPDVRVFTLCFDSKQPLDDLDNVTRREKLILLQDLDNFIFARDVIIVIAAGNSPLNTLPTEPYPRHFVDPMWRLGTWPRCFNALTCGSVVERVSDHGLVNELGAPSPFSRLGPGLAQSPKPDLSASGGDADPTFSFQPGLGVWCCSSSSLWEDCCGTSFAAPILARQAALTLHYLQAYCDGQTRPFAATVKALLALLAERPPLSKSMIPLAERALGHGVVQISRLSSPSITKALFVWQGVLESEKDLVRVQIPVPRDWVDSCEAPYLRISLAWDSPANAAVEGVWASRKVQIRLRFAPDGKAFTGSHGAPGSYPLSIREFNLKKWPKDEAPSGDVWLIELSYDQTAEDYIGLTFSPQQRAAFAAELFDAADAPVAPYSALDLIPLCRTMTRLGVRTAIRNPVAIKVRPDSSQRSSKADAL